MSPLSMSFTDEKSKNWRELHQAEIWAWGEKVRNIRMWGGYYTHEKHDMEILQLLQDQELRDIWVYVRAYAYGKKAGKYNDLFRDAANEIRKYGTIEPDRKKYLINTINRFRRRKGK